MARIIEMLVYGLNNGVHYKYPRAQDLFAHHSLAPRCSSFYYHLDGPLYILKVTLLDLDFEENISRDNKPQERPETFPTFQKREKNLRILTEAPPNPSVATT